MAEGRVISFRKIPNKETSPIISVVLFDYVNHKYVRESIKSVIEQNFPAELFELLIMTDDLEFGYSDILSKCNINWILVYTGTISIGRSILISLEYSEGNIICPLDNDDLFRRDRLSIVYKIFKASPGMCFLKNEVKPFSRSIKSKLLPLIYFVKMNIPYRSRNRIYELNIKTPLKIYGRSIMHNSSSMSISKDILKNNQTKLSELVTFPDSFMFIASLLSGRKCFYLDIPLTMYSVEIGSATRTYYLSDGVLKSRSLMALEHHISFFSDDIKNSSNRRLIDLFLLYRVSVSIILFINKNSIIEIQTNELINSIRIALKFHAHNTLLLIFLYLMLSFGPTKRIGRSLYNKLY